MIGIRWAMIIGSAVSRMLCCLDCDGVDSMKGKITGVIIDELANTPFNQRYDWCLENLGPATDSPPRWWPVDLGRGSFRFRDPADHLWFRLRWG